MRDYKMFFSGHFNDDEIKLFEAARSYAIATCRELWKSKSIKEKEDNSNLKYELYLNAGVIATKYLEDNGLKNLGSNVYTEIANDVVDELKN